MGKPYTTENIDYTEQCAMAITWNPSLTSRLLWLKKSSLDRSILYPQLVAHSDPISLSAANLRRELSLRNKRYAAKLGLNCRESYGNPPAICYLPCEEGLTHGNFLPATYRAILKNEPWRERLGKVHSQARSSLPREDRRWRELDSCNSSDALLMNIFCYPGTFRDGAVFDLLGVEIGTVPEFGVRAKVPLSSGNSDRTEVDMRLGTLLVEAKLTESDFQTADESLVESYRDFAEVFEGRRLPQHGGRFLCYQLLRNVMAAHHSVGSFCVLLDARRPDLMELWFSVMSCVRSVDLRLRCKVLTWQELAGVLPRKLQGFLEEKYGIFAQGRVAAYGERECLASL
jgi:hypothetical protein